MKESISDRLKQIAKYVTRSSKVADIGADHGKLLVHLVKSGTVIKGIAGELNVGPYQNAAKFIQKAGLQHIIDVRLGNGLSVIEEQVDIIVIAGMGGALIVNILDEGRDKLAQVQRLILQPNIGEYRVRQWLEQNNWFLVSETIVYEDGIYYEILVAEPNKAEMPLYNLDEQLSRELIFHVGPLLWKQKHPLLLPKQQLALERKKEVWSQLCSAKDENAIQKREELKKEIKERERMIEWLSKEAHS